MSDTSGQSDPLLGKVADALGGAAQDSRLAWRETARPDQLLPEGDWRVTYFQGGRGSGKTRSGAQGLVDLIKEDTENHGEWGIVAPTYRDAWTVCVEGEAGLLRALGTTAGEVKDNTSREVAYAYRSYGEVGLRNGHVIFVDSADDGALRVQGKNLKGAWCDEIGLWKRWQIAWDESIAFAVRRGSSKIIATGTPKVSRPAAKLIRRLIRDEPGTIVRRLRTRDNLANLSKAFYNAVVARASGTRLERQELEGELLDDVENALWTRELLEAIQVDAPLDQAGQPTTLIRYYIGVDPSDGTAESDEQAYTIIGLGEDNKLYVIESWGGTVGPVPFLKRVVLAGVALNDIAPTTLVLEKNHGGKYLEATLVQVMKDLGVRIQYRIEHASDAKRVRAEPVAALYERGKVRHAGGPFVELEDQMATFTGAQGERSPDRLDSLVWAVYPLLNHDFSTGQRHSADGPKKWAASAELAKIGTSSSDRLMKRMTGRRDETYDQTTTDWGIDSFAPQDPEEVKAGRGSRGNVREWGR